MDINKKSFLLNVGIAIGIAVFFILLAKAIIISGIDANVMVASASIFLAIITFFYATFTRSLLEEQKKLFDEQVTSKKIAFIERRLEKLYYPLRDVLQNPIAVDLLGGNRQQCIDLKKIDNIIPFQYLSSKELENLLDDFIKKAFQNVAISAYRYSSYDIVDDNIRNKVEEDIEKFRNELNELVKKRKTL